MAPSLSKKSTQSGANSKHDVRKVLQENEESDSDHESVNMMDKDSDEEELDRLVLGDGAGFTAQLGEDMDFDMKEDSEGEKNEDEDQEDAGIEGVDDADVLSFPAISKGLH